MAQQLDPATREALLARVRFYRDLGLTEFYRRPGRSYSELNLGEAGAAEPWTERCRVSASQIRFMLNTALQEDQPIPPRKPLSKLHRKSAASVRTADRAAALQLIREDIGDCTRCALHKGRNKIVFARRLADRAPDVCGRRVRAPTRTRRGCRSWAAPASC